jgi:antitoxin ParD1/3/4
MNVNLTPRLVAMVRQKVESGLYNSASEVVREALRLLEERDHLRDLRLTELRREIQRGLESGESRELESRRSKQKAGAGSQRAHGETDRPRRPLPAPASPEGLYLQ